DSDRDHTYSPTIPTRRSSDLRYSYTDQSCRRRELLQPNQGDRRETEYQRSERLVPDLAPNAGRNQVRDRRTGRIRMGGGFKNGRSEEHTSELQSRIEIVCSLL